MDYSDFPKTDRFFGGSERKIAVRINGEQWILKFQYDDGMKIRYNHVSEYIGSHVFESLGFDVQRTELGTYHGKQVVACRDFVPEGCMFVPFNDVGESTLEQDRDRFQYSYGDIMDMLRLNTKLTRVDETVRSFWDTYIGDALIGNFDRHGSNWGFLKCGGRYKLAPVFDNGSSLYPQMIDEDMMREVMSSAELTADRVYRFPTSQIKLGGSKSSYHDVISSGEFPECNDALLRVFPRIDLTKLNAIVVSTPFISEVHKRFYMHMLRARYELILRPAYEKAIG